MYKSIAINRTQNDLPTPLVRSVLVHGCFSNKSFAKNVLPLNTSRQNLSKLQRERRADNSLNVSNCQNYPAFLYFGDVSHLLFEIRPHKSI